MCYGWGLQGTFPSNFLFFADIISRGECQTANDRAGNDRFMI